MKQLPPCFLPILLLTIIVSGDLYGDSIFDVIDRVEFGNPDSEAAHAFDGKPVSQVEVQGEKTCRRIIAPKEVTWTGGSLRFTIRVEPDVVNYLSFEFHGSETCGNCLVMFIDGKQFGCRHLGDYETLHPGTEADAPPCPGQYYYITTVLPQSLTCGRRELRVEVRLVGSIWGYGNNFSQFQRNINGPSIAIYSAATHVQPMLADAVSAQTESITSPTSSPVTSPVSSPTTSPTTSPVTLPTSSPETPPAHIVRDAEYEQRVMAQVKERVNTRLVKTLADPRPRSQQELEYLARGYNTKWTKVYKNESIPVRVVEGADEYYSRWLQDKTLSWRDPGQYNNEWFGTAPLAEAIVEVDSPSFRKKLEEPVGGAEETISESSAGERILRRKAWGDLLTESLDYLITHRRPYTNQSMIIDWNIYRINRALAVVDAQRSLPERQTLRYLYESLGLEPWLGSETPSGPARPLGENYYQLTKKGLTRELGYVGNYGEVLGWAALIYRSTCPIAEDGSILQGQGNERILRQLIRMAEARAYFRYPSTDQNGRRIMRLETAVGWRDTVLCGIVTYGMKTDREGTEAVLPTVTNCTGFQQTFMAMVADGQYFPAVERLMQQRGIRIDKALMDVPWQYETSIGSAEESAEKTTESSVAEKSAESAVAEESAAARDYRPMMADPAVSQLVFTDEQNGVVAIKNGRDILYVSLYWRARYAINRLAKVHYIGPECQQFAVVRTETEFSDSGQEYVRPDWTTMGFGNGGGHIHYPERIHSVHAGERLPIARVPAEVFSDFSPGKENMYAGRGDLYTLQYGPYRIVMNMSGSREFEVTVPSPAVLGYKRVTELPAGQCLPHGAETDTATETDNAESDNAETDTAKPVTGSVRKTLKPQTSLVLWYE